MKFLRTAAKLTMYHGTCSGPGNKILRSILKEGLLPDPTAKAYKNPYSEEDDFYEGVDFETETTMSLNESLGGAYLTTDIDEAKKYAQHACGEHGGSPLLISAQIETRSPEVRIDEDFMVNYVWEFITADFEPENEETHYIELFKWLDEGDIDWEKIARGWIEQQFPHAKISDFRWNQVLPAAGKMLRSIALVTFLQHHEQEASSEAYDQEDEYWEIDSYYEIQDNISTFKENIEFVTDKLTEITTPPPSSGAMMHNVRVLKPVGYRGANRILAVISWSTRYDIATDEYDQIGKVYYARSLQDAKFLMGASKLLSKYSLWTDYKGDPIYDNPKEEVKTASLLLHKGAVYIKLAEKVIPSNRVTAEQVFQYMESSDYFDPEDKDTETYRAEAEYIAEIYNSLSEPIPVWRALQCEEECDIDFEVLGDHWTFEYDSIREYINDQFHTESVTILYGELPSDQIDWDATILAYLEYPQENEITLKEFGQVQNVKVVK